MDTLVILDLEGTGLPDHRRVDGMPAILELHMRVVDTATLKERASFHALPELPAPGSYLPLNAFCADMHLKNGLLERRKQMGASAVEQHRTDGNTRTLTWIHEHSLIPLDAVERLAVDFLKAQHGGDPKRLVLTGNSLANYDLPLLRHWLPGIVDQMHYRTYDVSVARTHHREILQQALPAAIEKQISGGSADATHRAADDTAICLRTIRQMREWADLLEDETQDGLAERSGWRGDWSHESDS